MKAVKQTAKQAARTLAQEPIEILRTAAKQVGGGIETQEKPKQEEPQKPIDQQKLKNQSARQLQALEAEIKDIRVQRQQEQVEKDESASAKATADKGSKFEAAPQVQGKPPRGLSFFKKRLGKNIEQRRPPSG